MAPGATALLMDLSVFAAVFSALGLKLLFGNHAAGVGTILLLAAVSAAGTVAIESFVVGRDAPRLDNVSVEDTVSAVRRAWGVAMKLGQGLV